jgi:hypothetical protein
MDTSNIAILDSLLRDHGSPIKSYDWFAQRSDQEKKIELGLLLKAVIADFKVFPGQSTTLCEQLRVLIAHFNADPCYDLPIYAKNTLWSNGKTASKMVSSSPIENAIKENCIEALRVIAEVRPGIFESECNLQNFMHDIPKNTCRDFLLDKLENILEEKMGPKN